MDKKRIAVFDFNAADCTETAEILRRHFRLRDEPIELAEFTDYSHFAYDFKENRDTGLPYDMAFIGVDSMMGVEVARHIRELDEWCPMFLISGVNDFAMEGYRLHALHYFSKPATAAKIKNAIERIGAKSLSGLQDPALFSGEGKSKESISFAVTNIKKSAFYEAQKRSRHFVVPIIICSAFVVLGILTIPGLYQQKGYQFFQDEPVPLAAPDFGNEISYPGMDNAHITAGTAEVTIPLRNPESNPCPFVFEIVLADTGEILFTSEPIAPGAGTETVTLNRPLEAGDYKALLVIRAYGSYSFAEEETKSAEFFIIAE